MPTVIHRLIIPGVGLVLEVAVVEAEKKLYAFGSGRSFESIRQNGLTLILQFYSYSCDQIISLEVKGAGKKLET
jgi:hypothetical protein